MDPLDEIRKAANGYGWTIVGVRDGSPTFTYSAGASERNLPEIIITGLHPVTCGMLINDFLEMLQEGKEILEEGRNYTKVANMPCQVKRLTYNQASSHMTAALRINSSAKCYQLVYPDPNGVFPWEDGYNFPKQELLYL